MKENYLNKHVHKVNRTSYVYRIQNTPVWQIVLWENIQKIAYNSWINIIGNTIVVYDVLKK